MENDWKKGIEDLKKINLTRKEKDLLLKKVFSPKKELPVKSPWLIFVGKHYLSIASVLVILVALTGLADLSRKSLPGDKLYHFKVQIAEPAQGFVKMMSSESAVWQAEKAVRRLEEAEILVDKGEFDEKKKKEIEALFNKHAQKFNQSIKKESIASTTPKNENENESEIEGIEIKKEKNEKKVKEIIEQKLEATKKIKAKSEEKSSKKTTLREEEKKEKSESQKNRKKD